MARKNLPVFERAEIINAAAEGKAIARVDGMVVFVPFAAPGDIADIRVVRKKKSFYEGRIVKLHQPSIQRTEPFCEHFTLCGGCSWQHVSYDHQLEFKRQQVIDNFKRIGKFDFTEPETILGSENTRDYRNKLEYTYSNRKWLTALTGSHREKPDMNGLGFHLPGMFDRILDINNCYLQPWPSNDIRLEARKIAIENGFVFYDHRKREGFLRNLIIRNSNTGECMVILVVNYFDEEKISLILDKLDARFPQITSLMYVVNTKLNDSLGDQEAILFKGKPYITEVMEDLNFRIGPLSFFQTNSAQALRLYQLAREMAGFQGSETVYDLYSGTGTIANFISRRVARVVGIEYVESAVDDARENARLNKIENTTFVAGDIAKVLNSGFINEYGLPHTVITDPPRAGMHEKVVQMLLQMAPGKIVYISCNPATQARDISMMADNYHVTRVQPVDMFPHTHHLENVVLMEKQ